MAHFITLIKFTQKGSETIRELPGRVERNSENLKKLGVELKSWHMTMGHYDVVAHFEASSDEAATKASLLIAASGNASCQTTRAFTMEETKALLSALPAM